MHKIYTYLICLFLILVIGCSDNDEQLQESWSVYGSGEYDKAVESFEQLAEEEQSVETLKGLAWSYLDNDQPDEAEKTFMQVIDKDPQNDEAMRGIASILIERKDIDGALTYLEKARAINPSESKTIIMLSRVYINKKDFESAKNILRELLEVEPLNNLARTNLGWTYYQLQDYDNAIENFEKSLLLNEMDGSAHVGLASSHFKKGELPAAQEAINNAPYLNNPYHHYRLAIYYNMTGDYDIALTHVDEALSFDTSRIGSDIEDFRKELLTLSGP